MGGEIWKVHPEPNTLSKCMCNELLDAYIKHQVHLYSTWLQLIRFDDLFQNL